MSSSVLKGIKLAVKILYVDVRDDKQIMQSFTISWQKELSASEAIRQTVKQAIADEIINDLKRNNPEIIVSWYHEETEDHSEMGGVGDLDWEIPDKSVLTITYENENTTPEQIDLSSDWMIAHSN
jgi:hypothetical protein